MTWSGDDPDAVHVNETGEIAGLTEKVSPASTDHLLIEDASASNVKKRVQIGNLPGGSGGDMTLISDQTLASAASAITFSAIPATYTDLLVVFELRSTRSGVANDDAWLRVGNGSADTGSNYRQLLNYEGSSSGTIRSAATTGIRIVVAATGATGDAGVSGVGEVKILRYATTGGHRLATGRGGVQATSGSYWEWRLATGAWTNTADAIDVVSLVPQNGPNWAAGSRAALYGLG